MKLSIMTLGCPDWSFEKILKKFEEYGVEGIEIRGLEDQIDADKIKQFLPENAESTLAEVKAHNLKLIGFGTSCSFHDRDNYINNIQQGKNSIDVCSRMKIPFIRVFGDVFPQEYSFQETIERVICGLKELCTYAAGKDVDVYMEIHGGFNTAEALQPVLEAMKEYPNFGILWDIEHSDRAYGDDVEAFYRLIRPFIRHLHVKDHFRAKEDRKSELCMVGQGEIPIPRLMSWLKRDGYTGYLSLEWEKKWHPELAEAEEAFPAYVQYMRALL